MRHLSCVVFLLAACGGGNGGDRYGATTDPPLPPSGDATPASCAAAQLRLGGDLDRSPLTIDEKVTSVAFAAPTDALPGVMTVTLAKGRGHVTAEYSGTPEVNATLPARVILSLRVPETINASNCATEPMQSTLRITSLEPLAGTMTGLRLRASATGDCAAKLFEGVVTGCFSR